MVNKDDDDGLTQSGWLAMAAYSGKRENKALPEGHQVSRMPLVETSNQSAWVSDNRRALIDLAWP